MMQVTEIKCLSSGVGGAPEARSPTTPHTLPRYALKRVTTALQIKLTYCSMPQKAMRASYHKIAGISISVGVDTADHYCAMILS